jgi:phosphate transport system substrate-binding protein
MKGEARMKTLTTTVGAVLLAASLAGAQAVQVDPRIEPYKKAANLTGNANSIGSDTMNNMMALWLEAFQKFYPSVKIQIEGKGSSTAPPALIEGTAQFGPMSRTMKAAESDKFEERFGYKPTPFRASIDALGVFVNKDNPLAGLSLPQIDAIFSKGRLGGLPEDITRWGQLGLKGEWENAPISLYGRNSASGTYGYFKEHALYKGDFKDQVKEQPGSASVVQGVNGDKLAIGYSGIGYVTSGVRVLPLASKAGQPFKEGTLQNVLDGSYPLGRYLYIYVNNPPDKPMDPLVKEFLRFVLSKEGQEIVVKDGFMPLPFEVVKEERAKL